MLRHRKGISCHLYWYRCAELADRYCCWRRHIRQEKEKPQKWGTNELIDVSGKIRKRLHDSNVYYNFGYNSKQWRIRTPDTNKENTYGLCEFIKNVCIFSGTMWKRYSSKMEQYAKTETKTTMIVIVNTCGCGRHRNKKKTFSTTTFEIDFNFQYLFVFDNSKNTNNLCMCQRKCAAIVQFLASPITIQHRHQQK